MNREILTYPYHQRTQQWQSLSKRGPVDLLMESLEKDSALTLRQLRPMLCPSRRKSALFRGVEALVSRMGISASRLASGAES